MNNDVENCFKKIIMMWRGPEKLSKSQRFRLYIYKIIYREREKQILNSKI